MPDLSEAARPRRIVVTGARGYIGSRLVPALLARGHQVVATASSDPGEARQPWAGEVTWVQMDALDPAAVASAVKGADAVCYLVHALDRPGYSLLDRQAADIMREAVSDAGVARLVYLSGLVPDVPRSTLSGHLSSRLEVEEILLRSDAATLSVRAGVVLGAGSTSFEIIRQMAGALLVAPVPSWLQSQIQPIGVGDVVALLRHALENDEPVGAVDVGGPDVMPYPELLAMVASEERWRRVQLPVPPVPIGLVARAAPLFTAAPARTVSALVESLRHDMVCAPEREWSIAGVGTPAPEAIRRSVRGEGEYAALPGDPGWASSELLAERVTGRSLPLPAVARTVAHTSEQRALDVLRGFGKRLGL